MEPTELIAFVREVSLNLMNKGEAMGQIYNCFDDEDILSRFAGLTKEEVVAKVVEMEATFAAYYDDIENA